MPYDSSVDQQIFAKSWEGNGAKITVGIYSYNKGPKKVQLTREVLGLEGRPGFAKLGRLTKEELQGILPLLEEAISQL